MLAYRCGGKGRGTGLQVWGKGEGCWPTGVGERGGVLAYRCGGKGREGPTCYHVPAINPPVLPFPSPAPCRLACHCGDGEEEVQSGMRIVSSSVYNQLMMFMLKEGDTLFRRLLALDSKANPRPEDVAKGARWVSLREQGGWTQGSRGGWLREQGGCS